MKSRDISLFQKEQVQEAFRESFLKLYPGKMLHNPVMFTVEIGTLVMLVVTLSTLAGNNTQGTFGYNLTVFIILL